MTYPKDESGKWAQVATKAADEYVLNRDKILDNAAARGFGAVPGDAVFDLFELGQDTKGKLMESLGKIYNDRRGTLFQQEEFLLKVLVQVGKLGMDLYREELVNALALEAADEDAWATKSRADVERLNVTTESRQIAITRARAEIEHDIAMYKQQLTVAEKETLGSERTLVYAQLATAEKKLEIIKSIYQVLAAEQLVLAAERRKFSSLSKVLDAERIVAEIQKEMIPFYSAKADAKVALAQAIKDEIPVQKAIVELGYDKIAVENAKEMADHVVRQAQEDEAQAQSDYTKAALALEFTRMQGRRLLQELSIDVKRYVQDQKEILEQENIDLRLDSALARETITVNNEVAVTAREISNLTTELASILTNLGQRALDHATTVRDSASQVQLSASTTHTSAETSLRRIFKG